MSLIAEYEVRSPLMRAATEEVPGMEIRGEDIFIRDDGNPKYLFWAKGGSFEAFEAALESDPSIARYAVITRIDGNRFYRVTFSGQYEQHSSYRVASEHDIVFLDTALQDGVARIQARVPSRAALRAYREFYEDSDIPFELIRLYREGSPDDAGQLVTENQREALLLALDRGYYDSPRTTKLDDVAADLDITRQALADRLKRGTRRLVAGTLRDSAFTK